MSRKLKPYKVSEVFAGPARMRVDILLDREELVYFANVLGQKIADKNVEVVKKFVLEFVNENQAVTWQGAIRVELAHPRNDPPSVSISLSRFYWARLGEKLIQRDWDDERISPFHKNESGFNPPCNEWDEDEWPTFFFPYSEELWEGLNVFRESVVGLSRNLIEMMKNGTWQAKGHQIILDNEAKKP